MCEGSAESLTLLPAQALWWLCGPRPVTYHFSRQRVLAAATAATSSCVPWVDSGWRKQDTGPRQLRCTSKEWFQWAQTLSSPPPKNTKFINLRYVFSLSNSNLLMFQLPGFCCQDSYISWFLPYLFRTIPQSYLRGSLLSLIPQCVRQVKHNPQLLDGAFFFQLIALTLTLP